MSSESGAGVGALPLPGKDAASGDAKPRCGRIGAPRVFARALGGDEAAFFFGFRACFFFSLAFAFPSVRWNSWSSVPFLRFSSSASSNSLMSCSFLLTLLVRAFKRTISLDPQD